MTTQTSMNRRQLLTSGAAAALVATMTHEVLAEQTAPHAAHAGHTSTPNQAVITAAMACIEKGQECLSHCLAQFQTGDTSLAKCASDVVEMLSLSKALSQLASMNSKHLAKLAAVCLDACKACEAECRKHGAKHASCQSMADACTACGKACQSLI